MVYTGKNAASSPAAEEPRIGVFICHCGTNIAGSLDVPAVREYAETIPHVVVAQNYAYMCSTPGQNMIKEAIEQYHLTGIVVAACTPRLHEQTFRTATANGGLNQFRFEMANIRDQGSWVHIHDWEGGTAKAKDAIRIAVAKAAKLEDLYPMAVPVEHRALVVGAGIGGIQASMDLAAAGIETYLIEKEPTIGGRMSQLDKTFPTLDCSQCILSPKMAEAGRTPNIKLYTLAEVEHVEGYIGNFDVTIRRHARGVLTPTEAAAKGIVGGGCTGCGDCATVCPVVKPNTWEFGMAPRKAIYIQHAQVVPLIYTIDFDACVKCGLCVTACGTKKAIDLEMEDELFTIKVGTVIIATGYETFPIEQKKEWGYKLYDNVITSLEFERLICASGPTIGHLVRPSDGETPKSVGFVLCAGSRENTGVGKPYCSRFCCMYSLKHAHQVIEKIPGCKAYIFYMDIRSFGKAYEEFYYRIQHEGAKFIRGRVAMIQELPNKNLLVIAEDTLLGMPVEIEVDLVVLAAAIQPTAETEIVRRHFGVSCSIDKWLLEAHPKLNPCGTTTAGVYLAGVCQGPKDIPDTVAQAEGAASAAIQPTAETEIVRRHFGVSCSIDKWLLEAHPKLNPCGTTTAGVYLAGVCQGPKDIPDTVAQAEGAASAASIPIHSGQVELEPYYAQCIQDLCAGCGMCVNLCPYSALSMTVVDGRTVMEVTAAKCKGCGTCGGFCPGGAIKMQHFTSPQILAQIDAFFLGGEQ